MSDEKDEPTLEELVYVAIGHASMCWIPRPEGVFDSTEASKVGAELVKALRARGAR